MQVIYKGKQIEVELFDSATYITKDGIKIPIGNTQQINVIKST